MNTCNYLIQMGTDLKLIDKFSETSLLYAAKPDLVRLFLSKGADLEASYRISF